jgi:hypothetical protein
MLAKGAHTAELAGAANAKATHQLVVTGDKVEHFEFGFVDVGAGKSIVVGPGVTTTHLALEVGPHTVTIADANGTHPVVVRIKAGATANAN